MRAGFRGLLAGAALAALVGVPAANDAQAQDRSINLGWVAWSCVEVTTRLAQHVLEEEMDYEVELTLADAAGVYQGVRGGSVDAYLGSWLPDTHADYFDQTATDVEHLGVLYTDARLGWVVPDYIPEDQLSSLEDLHDDEVREMLGGQIQGIDPGAGLTRLSNEAMEVYGLDDYELVIASDAAMTAALERAIRRDEWIVATGWSPHWMFGAWDLRYLDDPEGALGGAEWVQKIARAGFYRDHPEAAGMLARMYFPIEDLEAMMFEAEETDDYEGAAQRYAEENPERIQYWVTGEQ